MNDFVESLKQIDWVKNVIYFFVFVLSVVVVFFILVSPAIEAFRVKNIQYRKSELVYNESVSEFESKQQALKQFQQENRPMLSAFATPFREETVERISIPYFEAFDSKVPRDINHTDVFQTRVGEVVSKVKTPDDLYNYIEFLSRSGQVIRMGFPIEFEQTRQGLIGKFTLIYYTDDKATVDSLMQ